VELSKLLQAVISMALATAFVTVVVYTTIRLSWS